MKRCVPSVFLLIVLVLSHVDLVTAQINTTMQRSVPEDQFIELLKSGQFEVLSGKLQSLHRAYVADRRTENEVHKAFYAFYRADPEVQQALDNWANADRNSAMPYLARGLYRTRMGWTSRGGAWASDTSASQFSGMAAWFKAAKEDLTRAAEIDPGLIEAYCYLIEIDMNEGRQNTRRWFDRAIKENPRSFIAREFYIHTQVPRWGGSFEAMQQTIVGARPFYEDMPQLKALEGRVAADVGEMAAYRKDFKEAIKQFDRALENGNFWVYNQGKGEALWEIDDYRGAIEQFSQVIRDKPGYKRAWWMRSQAYRMLGQFQDALADINYAIKMEPNDDLVIAARGYIYWAARDFASALKDFEAAARRNPSNATHQQAIETVKKLAKVASGN